MFEILVLCYGNFPHLSKRCLDSIIYKATGNDLRIHVGMNQCGTETRQYIRDLLDNGLITTAIDSNINLNKDPMMRKLIDCVSSDYLMWFDDDGYVAQDGWNNELNEIIQNNPNTDVFGFPHISGRDSSYSNILQQRPWYDPSFRFGRNINFPIGGLWIAKKTYLINNDYPDRGMKSRLDQHMDDRLLGDMMAVTGGKFYTLDGWESKFFVNKSDRRGEGD